jgi:hypothetical protein
MRASKFISAIGVFLWCGSLYAQNATMVTPCELIETPGAYDRALITVRAPVTIGFEDSSLVANCGDPDKTSIWVMFGGDVETPITYCCGDHSRKPGSTLTVGDTKVGLRKDATFNQYFRLLTSQLKNTPSGVPCFYDCYQYKVTATLTGRFFAGEKTTTDDGKDLYYGYGHLGCCSLFVIQKVEDVEAEPTGIPISDRFECSHQSWPLSVDRNNIIAQQKAVLSHALNHPEVNVVGEKLLRERLKETGEKFEDGENRWDFEGKDQDEKKATYVWLSKDKLRSYTVRFEGFDWLSPFAKNVNDRIWTPIQIEYSSCKPKP